MWLTILCIWMFGGAMAALFVKHSLSNDQEKATKVQQSQFPEWSFLAVAFVMSWVFIIAVTYKTITDD